MWITKTFLTTKKRNSLLRNSSYLKNYDNDQKVSKEINNNPQILNNTTATKEISSSSFNHIKKVLKRPYQKINCELPLKKKCYISNNTDVHTHVIEYIKAKRSLQNENSRKQHLLSLIPRINKMNAIQHRKFCSQINVLIDGLLNTRP